MAQPIIMMTAATRVTIAGATRVPWLVKYPTSIPPPRVRVRDEGE